MIVALFIVVAFIVVGFISYCYWFQNYSWTFKQLNRIPGPPSYPIIGDLFASMKTQEQFFITDRKRALDYFPIYRISVFNTGIVCLISPDDVELVLSGTKHMKKGDLYQLFQPWLGTGLLTSEGAKWQTRRKILTPAFHFNILQGFVNIFNEETVKLVEHLEKRLDEPYVDVVPIITQLTLFAITETSMGTKLNLKNKNSENYKKAVYDFGKILTYRVGRPWLMFSSIFQLTKTAKAFNKVIETLHSFSRSVIADRKEALNNSKFSSVSKNRLAMLDLLLTAQMSGADINDEGIREEVDTFIFEGHDTTSVSICFSLMVLANHRKIQDEIFQEITEVLGNSQKPPTYQDLQDLNYMERCLKECLRLYPSVHFIAREATEDIQTATGYLIPKGTQIHLHIYDVHHNPNNFPDPEKFDPDRFLPENTKNRHPFAYIPFSAGSRNCIGQRFAMLELKAVLCGILRNFVLEPVDGPEDLTMVTDLVLRSKHGINIKFVPRQQPPLLSN